MLALCFLFCTIGVNSNLINGSWCRMEEKHFEEWIELKSGLHFNARCPRIHEGEVWWCSFGENVGVEINGKSSRFTRPVVIMKKLSKFGFMGVPLTSQEKTGSWYARFGFFG